MMLLKTSDHTVETIAQLLLLRFGMVVAVVVAIILAIFAVALVLRRRGKLPSATRGAAPVVRTVIDAHRARQAARNGSASALDSIVTAAVSRYLDDHEHDHDHDATAPPATTRSVAREGSIGEREGRS